MLVEMKQSRRWSEIGLRGLVISVVMAIALAFVHGILRGPLAANGAGYDYVMVDTWVYDLRFFFDQGMLVAAVLFVGAKFFETRTVFTIGFDAVDAQKMTVKGPDGDNVVWVGHRYNSPLEAEAIAGALQERLKASAVV